MVDLNEDVNYVEQNRRAIEAALGHEVSRKPFHWIGEDRRTQGRDRIAAEFAHAGIQRGRPLVGIHPGAGRRIKEWPMERFIELGRRLVKELGASLVVTGSAAEGGKAVAKMNDRALLMKNSRRLALQATKPPNDPSALLRVPIATSTHASPAAI